MNKVWNEGLSFLFTLCSGFLPKPSHGDFGQFFPTGTYTGIGTSVLSLKHVMKSTTKKKVIF